MFINNPSLVGNRNTGTVTRKLQGEEKKTLKINPTEEAVKENCKHLAPLQLTTKWVSGNNDIQNGQMKMQNNSLMRITW